MSPDARLHAPATVRNRQPILDLLKQYLPARGLVLEVASGSGEHIAYFAQACPDLTFQPSDPDFAHRASTDAWTASLGQANVRPAIDLDVSVDSWAVESVDAILC